MPIDTRFVTRGLLVLSYVPRFQRYRVTTASNGRFLPATNSTTSQDIKVNRAIERMCEKHST